MSEQEDVIEIVAKVASPASAGWQAAEAPAAAPAGGRQPAAQGEPGKASEQPPAGTADGGTQPWTEAEAEQASDASCQRQPADTTGPHAMDAAELVRPETEEEITADAGLDDDVSDDAGSGTTAADQDGTGDEQAQQAQQAAAAADAAQAAAAEEAVLAGSAAAETVKQKSQPSAADEHAKEASNPQADTLARAADEAAAGPKPSPAAQPAGEAAPASNHPNPAQRNLQALHDELLAFAAEAAPTSKERKRRDAALEAVKAACTAAFPTATRATVRPFGSFVHGMSLPGADLDLVVTGMMSPIARGGGFTSEQRDLLNPLLKRLSNKLQETGAVRKRPLIISNARVPIIKSESADSVRLDICFNSDEGPRAAEWLTGQCNTFAVLRPLCLALKALLAEQRLNDASTGGLSTWSLCCMAVALLQEQRKAELGVDNAGHLLLGFLKYYGRVFDLESQAVSVKRGGVVAKEDVPAAAAKAAGTAAAAMARGEGGLAGPLQARPRLCVEDPLTGRDVSVGTHRIEQVCAALSDAAAKLELLLKQGQPPPDGFLPFLFNVDAALLRRGAGDKAGSQRGEKRGSPAGGAPPTVQAAAKRARAEGGPAGAHAGGSPAQCRPGSGDPVGLPGARDPRPFAPGRSAPGWRGPGQGGDAARATGPGGFLEGRPRAAGRPFDRGARPGGPGFGGPGRGGGGGGGPIAGNTLPVHNGASGWDGHGGGGSVMMGQQGPFMGPVAGMAMGGGDNMAGGMGSSMQAQMQPQQQQLMQGAMGMGMGQLHQGGMGAGMPGGGMAGQHGMSAQQPGQVMLQGGMVVDQQSLLLAQQLLVQQAAAQQQAQQAQQGMLGPVQGAMLGPQQAQQGGVMMGGMLGPQHAQQAGMMMGVGGHMMAGQQAQQQGSMMLPQQQQQGGYNGGYAGGMMMRQ